MQASSGLSLQASLFREASLASQRFACDRPSPTKAFLNCASFDGTDEVITN